MRHDATFSRPYRALLRSSVASPRTVVPGTDETIVPAWRNPIASSRSGISSRATRPLTPWRTHPAAAESIAAASAEVRDRAPAAGLTTSSIRPSSAPAVTSEPPHPRPTAAAVDGDGEPTCLVKSGHPPARRTFFSEAEAERLALGPGLPHQRHRPLTADEAVAALILVVMGITAVIYLVARLL